MPTSSARIHFGDSFSERPGIKRQIRSALEDASGPDTENEPEAPAWIVIQDDIEGASTLIAHHTASQFTLTAPSASNLCRRIEQEMSEDRRFDNKSFRLDGRPDTRPDHGPGNGFDNS
jgi:hypothetical protein